MPEPGVKTTQPLSRWEAEGGAPADQPSDTPLAEGVETVPHAKVAITGSSGMVGTALSEQLRAGGRAILRIVHGAPGESSAHWSPEHNWFQDDALHGADAVIHLAGANIAAERWSEERKAELVQSRVAATRLLVDQIGYMDRRPQVLVSASAVGFYGSRGDDVLDEQSHKGDGFLADLCEAWEREAMRAEALGVRVVIVRTGIVLSTQSGFLARLLPLFRVAAGGPLGDGSQWFSWISLRDLVSVYQFLIETDSVGVFNAVAPQPVRNRDFSDQLGSALNRPSALRVPEVVLDLAAGQERTEELLVASQRVRPARLTEAGFVFQDATLRDALSQLLKD